MKSKFDKAKGQKIAKLYRGGMTLECISGVYHCSVGAIRNALRSQKVKMRPRGRRPSA